MLLGLSICHRVLLQSFQRVKRRRLLPNELFAHLFQLPAPDKHSIVWLVLRTNSESPLA